ncbi:MAG TPA: hypothetical protein VHF27_06280 [Acidimicrobiales bacterium]|nr:hypothetical protein [Acidimicrobiales bacterium]
MDRRSFLRLADLAAAAPAAGAVLAACGAPPGKVRPAAQTGSTTAGGSSNRRA